MASTQKCAICLCKVGVGAARATIDCCRHVYCTQCVLQLVLDHNSRECPACRASIGSVQWSGGRVELGPAAAAAPADPGDDLFFTSQGTLVCAVVVATETTVEAVAQAYNVPSEQLIAMNTARENPWVDGVTSSSVLVAGSAVWLWHVVD